MHEHNLIKRSLVGGLVIAATCAPAAAQARPVVYTPAARAPIAAPVAHAVATAPSSSFQWGDAGIGAAGAAALLGTAAVAAAAIGRHTARRGAVRS